MAERGRTIPLGDEGEWWLRLARERIREDLRPRRVLAVELAKHLPDKPKFDHAHLTKFAAASINPRTGRAFDPSLDLIEAICREYRLPPPLFFARSYNEAVHILGTSERYDRVPVESPPASDVTPLPKIEERARRRKSPQQNVAVKPATAKRRTRSA